MKAEQQLEATQKEVADLKAAMEKIARLNVDLEQRVIQRTAQLEAAKKELESFSYSVSHDLRAPLRAMAGFAHILERELAGQIPPGAKQAVERIRDNAAKMSQLIDRLLDFCSLSWLPLTKRKVDPAAVARAVFEELRPDAQTRGVQIEIAALPPCDADPNLLKQVFVNLISNGLKYTRERDPATLKVGCRQDTAGSVYFVQDNGAGFDMQYADKLFRVFQRLHRSDQFEGTGVGLAIVHRIIERHGGRIWAEARLNQGATFYFTLGEH